MNRRSVATVLLLLFLSLAAGRPYPGSAASAAPVPGIHTIRADDNVLQLAADSGYTWMVQLMEWREIEPAPGEFFWEYADWLVRAAEYYRLDLALRLDHPPEWALSTEGGSPVDIAAYSAFVSRVAARYRGRLLAYIIWNEPNLALEWDEQPPDPAGYTRLLCAARSALQKADPGALVVSAGLAPTNHTDASALDDRLFLQEMYAAGAGECFDILSAHPYGFAYPPQDPHEAHDSLNFARLSDLRALMVAEGESGKPIWATELGWTTDPVGDEQQWLAVSEEEQARYLVGAFEKAAQDWPWLERIAVWHLSTGLPYGDSMRGYGLLAADGTPKPAYRALAKMIGNNGSTGAYRKESALSEAQAVEILAPDVVVRLSDPDTFYPHWARPHCGYVPCRQWTGQFYVTDPGVVPWQLQVEIMQVEEPGNLIWINGRQIDPPALPLRDRPDFASVWTAIEIPVPAVFLQPGANTVEIRSSPRLPVYQYGNGRFESLQIRNARLTRGS